MRRLRVLLSAYACSPARGSEPGLGWNVATRLARFHDITVLFGDLTREQTSSREVAAWVDAHGRIPGLTFHYVPPTRFARSFERAHRVPGLKPLYYIAYRAWQRSAFAEASRLHSERPFDIVHQLNMIGFREPGFLHRLGAPFVWGPVGGAPDEPWPFIWGFGPRAALGVSARRIANWVQKRVACRPREAARRAARIWTVTQADFEMVTGIWRRAAVPLIETGTVPTKGRVPVARRSDEPLRLVWSGLHIPRKSLPIVLHALSRARLGAGVELSVLGAGPETAAWQRLAVRLGVAPRIRWLGWRPRDEAVNEVSRSHALVFPSVKEGSPAAVFEAIGLGVPVVCHDACGMGAAITSECGIKVPLRNPQTSIQGFASAIEKLRDDAGLVERLSIGALARSEELTWDRKAEYFATTYCDVLREGRP